MKEISDRERERGSKMINAENKKAETLKTALIFLDVDLKRLEREPKFMSMLEHHSLGGLPQVLAAMRLSSDLIVMKFLERFDALNPAYQKIIPWEAVAQLAGIESRQLLGAIIIALREHSAMEVKVAALTAHPEITKATVSSAMVPGND